MIVECIDNRGMENQLTQSKVYRVTESDTKIPYYRLMNDLGNTGGYHKTRFNIISEDKLQNVIDTPEQVETIKVSENSDLIDKQEHYTNNGIQPIDIMKKNMTKEAYRGFLEGNVLKYPLRYKDKNGLEDLKKAKTYLTWLINDIEERGL